MPCALLRSGMFDMRPSAPIDVASRPTGETGGSTTASGSLTARSIGVSRPSAPSARDRPFVGGHRQARGPLVELSALVSSGVVERRKPFSGSGSGLVRSLMQITPSPFLSTESKKPHLWSPRPRHPGARYGTALRRGRNIVVGNGYDGTGYPHTTEWILSRATLPVISFGRCSYRVEETSQPRRSPSTVPATQPLQ